MINTLLSILIGELVHYILDIQTVELNAINNL
jgi:hypothetical protein